MTTLLRLPTCLRAVAFLGVLSTASAFAAPTVGIFGPSSVVPGGAVQLDITAAGFTDLYAYQFDITFQPSVFNATVVSRSGFLATAGSTFFDAGLIDNTTGVISFVFESLIGPNFGASGAGTLARLRFNATGPRLSSGSFAITNFVAYDSALNAVDVRLQGLSVSVPEPSALSLVLLAMGAGVFGVANRKRRQARAVTAGA